MADNNTYTSKQNIKKYTTQTKFDAIDKSDVPVGTEYNIVGSITESDLDSDLQAKVNLTGDGLTTEVTGGKVKVKNPMTSTGGDGFRLNSFYNTTTGVTYFFPIETPIGHFATGIVPILGSITATSPGSTSPATYYGLFLQNAYAEDNYNASAYSLITATNSFNSGNQIYILPHCSSNPGVSRLLSTESLEAGPGITIQNASAPGRLKISSDGNNLPTTPSGPYAMLAASGGLGNTPTWLDIRDEKIQANFLVHDNSSHTASYNAHETGAIFEKYATILKNGTSADSKFVLMAPAIPDESPNKVTLLFPFKSGTIATLDDITGGGGITTTELNETPSSRKTITVAELQALDTGFYNASNCILKGDVDLPAGYYHLIKIKAANGTDGSLIAQDHDNGDTYVLTFRLSGSAAVGWSSVVYTQNLPTFKTLFGDQSIEGDGNIDLYKHIVSITGEADSQEIGDTVLVEGHIIFYSSKNLDCNSLTDLKTVLGDTFIEKAFGYVTRPSTGDIWSIDYVDETKVYFYGTTSQGQTGKASVTFTMEIVDNVTTI